MHTYTNTVQLDGALLGRIFLFGLITEEFQSTTPTALQFLCFQIAIKKKENKYKHDSKIYFLGISVSMNLRRSSEGQAGKMGQTNRIPPTLPLLNNNNCKRKKKKKSRFVTYDVH